MSNHDLMIIGSGPGGYVAAIRAAQLGMKVAIVERESLGGICLNWGCIPTKALLRSSEIFHLVSHAEAYGLSIENPKALLDKIVQRSRDVAKQLSNGVGFLMKKHKIEVLEGTARLEKGKGAPKVIIEKGKGEGSYTPKRVLVATGARAREIPDAGLKADGKTVWTYRDAMVPDELPKKLLVIGSGAIGIEFASFYRTLGSEVTVVEAVDRILPVEDAEIAQHAAKQFTKQGMKLITAAKVKSLKVAKGKASAEIEVAGKTDESGRTIAESTLRDFQPALVLNRVSGRARVNVPQLKKLLKEYVGGGLTLLGEIPEDPAMEQAVRAYTPVIQHAPSSPAATALTRMGEALLHILSTPSARAA